MSLKENLNKTMNMEKENSRGLKVEIFMKEILLKMNKLGEEDSFGKQVSKYMMENFIKDVFRDMVYLKRQMELFYTKVSGKMIKW